MRDWNVPETIGERADKIARIHNHAVIQNMNMFQVNRLGNMVKRYGGNLRTYTKVSNAISETFDLVTTNIRCGNSHAEVFYFLEDK